MVGRDSLVIVLHEELKQALSGVALGEVGCQSNAFVCIFDAIWISPQLCEASGSVAVQLVCFRIYGRRPPLQCLTVELDCFWELLLPEGLQVMTQSGNRSVDMDLIFYLHHVQRAIWIYIYIWGLNLVGNASMGLRKWQESSNVQCTGRQTTRAN